MARNQWRMGLDAPVGLDYCAVRAIAEQMHIDISPCVIKKLDALEEYTLEYWRKKRDEDGKRH